jgi:hypothetical protein
MGTLGLCPLGLSRTALVGRFARGGPISVTRGIRAKLVRGDVAAELRSVEEQGAGGGLSKHDLVPAGTDRDRGEPRRAVDEPQLEVEIA